MTPETRRFYAATLTLIGTVIGVGIFGVPYALSRAGALVGLAYFALLGGIQLLQHLFFAEAAIAAPEPLRLAGLVRKYLGPGASRVAGVATVLGFWGGILAYWLVGGAFLQTLLGPWLGGSLFAYQLGWAVLGGCAVYFGLDLIMRLGVAATIGLVAALAAIFAAGAPHVSAANFTFGPGTDLFLPYGVILFSLSGLPAILEMEEVLGGDHRRYRTAVVAGTLASLLLTAAFGFMVWGITGTATTQDAAAGLEAALGHGITAVIAACGFLAVATSFFATALFLQSTFEDDYRMRHWTSWLLMGGVPFAVLMAGAQDFVAVIGFSGAVFGGITAVLVAMLYIAVVKGGFVKEKKLGAPLWTAYASIVVLSLGAVYETITAAMKLG